MRSLHTYWGARLRAARLAAGLTQVELADRSGCDQRYITKWENGRAIPNDHNRQRLARGLGIPTEELFAYPRDNGDDQAAA